MKRVTICYGFIYLSNLNTQICIIRVYVNPCVFLDTYNFNPFVIAFCFGIFSPFNVGKMILFFGADVVMAN